MTEESKVFFGLSSKIILGILSGEENKNGTLTSIINNKTIIIGKEKVKNLKNKINTINFI